MTDVEYANLDEYSRFAVARILARFPEWESTAKIVSRPDGSNVVEFQLECPSQPIEYGLWVSTADEEMTVGFDIHHTHFTDYEHRLNVAQVDAGLEHLADILAERIGVVGYYLQGNFVGSRSIKLPHEGPLPGLFQGSAIYGLGSDLLGQYDRTTLRSWTGRYDRDE